MNAALALRVAIVGSVTLALFAIIFFRLWFLQVLTGNQYVKAAAVNQTRNLPIAPPRGEILDRNGTVLVNSTTALALKISPSQMPVPLSNANVLSPPRRDTVVYNRLAHLLGTSTKRHRCKVPIPPPSCTRTHCPANSVVRLSHIGCTVANQIALATYADVTIKRLVGRNLEFYIDERQSQYPGVQVEQVSVTGYPDKTLAAQVLGTVGQISHNELHEKAYKGANRNAVVGQTGLEAEYDSYLRGTFGEQRIEINAAGEPTGQGSTKQPKAGENLQTSLDAKLQQVGQNALATSMSENDSPGGAFVAMSPSDGSVYAMGSLPSFDPEPFAKGISSSAYKALTDAASGDPLLNRAIQSVGPTGSTFKPITATAALESGSWSLADTYDDTGEFCFGTTGRCLRNAGGAAYGSLNLTNAIKVSDDVFFYNLGSRLNSNAPRGGALQQWARRFGIGASPDIDLPGALKGTLPDAGWRGERDREELECEHATGAYRYVNAKGLVSPTPKDGYHRAARRAECGIADGRPWSVGDNVNLAVGQGDVQVSPLQLAVAYSALANGGTIVRPHIGESIQNPDGTVLQKIDPPASRKLNVNPIYLSAITEGLHEAAQGGGTSSDVMGSFPKPVYGKTGTAQYGVGVAGQTETDYAWYACYVPATATSKPIVVVVWVEKGGFGDVAAAPVARQILSQWFFGKPGTYTSGSSTDQ